jgi:hypothetical protein
LHQQEQALLRSHPFFYLDQTNDQPDFQRISVGLTCRTKMNGHSFYACTFLICYLPDVKKNRQNKAEQQNLSKVSELWMDALIIFDSSIYYPAQIVHSPFHTAKLY